MISHFFWKYYDKSDPAYPGHTIFENYLLDFYKLHDAIVLEFMKHIDQNVSLMIMSDHGHGMRPPRTININEILRNFGYLKSKNKTYSDKYNIAFSNMVKNRLMPIVKRIGGEEFILKIAKQYPKSRDIYKSLNIIDHENSIAYLSSFTGSKTYYYGGIEINKKFKSTQTDYEKIRNDLIRDLNSVINPITDQKLIRWICKKEDLYQGKYIEKYPDILFELNDNFGIGWDVHNDIVGIALDHDLAPGGHKNEAVFLINDKTNNFSNQTISIMDIAPTILDILQIPHSRQFDGKILKKGEF
jgi:predicted AlkP superfamily phosphohydrolase/phosphomutase